REFIRCGSIMEGCVCRLSSGTNIGIRPTFNGSALSIETHVLDWVPGLPASSGLPDVTADLPGPAGLRPTVPPGEEAGLKTIATKRIEIRFLGRLRDEKKIAGPEKLPAQNARHIPPPHRVFSRLRRFRPLPH